MIKRRILILSIILIALLTATTFIVAQDDFSDGPYANHPDVVDLKGKIYEKETELNTLKESQELYLKRIEESREQSVSLSSQLKLLDNQTTKIELDIKTTQLTIDKAKLQIESVQFQVEKEVTEINTQKDRLKEYIKLINKEDQRSLLEVLIINESFSEFFNQLNYIEGIQAEVKGSVDRLNLLKTNLEVQKSELEQYQVKLEENKVELEQSKMKLKEQVVSKETLLFETKHSEIKYQKLLSEAQQIQNDVASSINGIEEEIKRKISRLSSGNTNPSTTLLMWPVNPSRGITAYFHDPTYPYRYLFEHPAIDIRAYQRTPIKAPSDAYVARARDNGYGYSYITLIHDNGISTVYGHVSAIYVKQDQFIKAGDIIGLSGGAPGSLGAGGLTSGPHLHLEVRLNGIPVDPLQYLP